MKRKIFSVMAIAAIAFVSCKKDELNSTELGTATINGNIWADLDLTDTDVEGVNGMPVTVVVNTMEWDQQPVPGYNYDDKVYSTTTSANGDYSLTIDATESGFDVDIMFEDIYTTRTNQDGTTSNVKVSRGDITKFIWSGAVISTKDQATIEVDNANNQSYGTATIYGTIFMPWDQSTWDGNIAANQKYNTTSGQTQTDIKWMYDNGNAPYGVTDNTVYTATFDYATGDYMITVPTESLGGSNVLVDIGFTDFQGTMTGNNAAFTADSTLNGIWTCGGISAVNNVSVIDGDLMVNMDIGFGFNPF